MCRFRCEWLAVTRLSRQEIKRVIKHPDCNAPLGRSLSWLKSFTFAESPDAEPLQGTEESRRPQVVTEMHGWLRLTLNDTSVFSGYHGYHQDGPHMIGRFHKVFVMVEKNRTTERREDASAALTNLMAVNAQTRYMVNCELEDESWDMARFECRPRLYPGDILFFREDVWHSTQDMALDRISLILDVWRMPLRTTPISFIEKGSKAVISERSSRSLKSRSLKSRSLKVRRRSSPSARTRLESSRRSCITRMNRRSSRRAEGDGDGEGEGDGDGDGDGDCGSMR
jgi:hypothetical protein